MKRREFFASSLGMVAGSALPALSPQEAATKFPNVPGLTKYVSEFIVNTKYKDIGSARAWAQIILDGFGRLRLRLTNGPARPPVRREICHTGSKASIKEPG
jgi:hypothetical protein